MKRLQITIVNRSSAEFRGHGSRELYQRLTGRPPVRNARGRSWVTTPKRARDLAALAEVEGYDVTVDGGGP